jgi:hypothetical protein
MTLSKKVSTKRVETLKSEIRGGKGVDIGTAFIKCAEKRGESIVFQSQRNAFFEIEHSDFTKKILDNSKVEYIVKGGQLYIVGDAAMQFANMFGRETRRPLSQGVISPTEQEALPMVELLMKHVVGKPAHKDQVVYYSVPGEPLDADFNIIYHEKMIDQFLRSLGYLPKAINEGQAVILSELAEEDFTGIGLSLGGGMVNFCLSFLSVPVFAFSLTKGGDWIDRQVALATNETSSRISLIKESSLDLTKTARVSKVESALSVYYNHLIEYVVDNMKAEVIKYERVSQTSKPLTVILSGGTALPPGFAGRFQEILEQHSFPLVIGSVRPAGQPLRSVAKGALVAASAHETAR